ncbi:beta-microseminoprotein-like [Hypomesus transpacificus]|uniref:beta-microseminoprotein-like n=1 Tax=Hypomesus transpacificus TaxID=137520 RepID=UPI001F08582A|nr:beta-microseminoprotein-like [Hypomesus transpacificus]
MRSLVLAVLLCALPSMLNAACFLAGFPGETKCQDAADQTWHAVGSTWRTSDCLRCTCRLDAGLKVEMRCCHAYLNNIRIPDDCVSKFDKKTCQHIVHKKDDPSTNCPILEASGK